MSSQRKMYVAKTLSQKSNFYWDLRDSWTVNLIYGNRICMIYSFAHALLLSTIE